MDSLLAGDEVELRFRHASRVRGWRSGRVQLLGHGSVPSGSIWLLRCRQWSRHHVLRLLRFTLSVIVLTIFLHNIGLFEHKVSVFGPASIH